MSGLLASAVAGGAIGPDADIRQLEALADDGDGPAQAVYANAGSTLARGVAALITVLDPEKVIILGEGTEAWRHWDAAFRTGLIGHIAGPMRDTPIEVEPWDDSSWAQGAAALVLATPFDLDGMAGHQAEHVLARLAGATA
jgi:predicted NBD/HSP70 family sugar kinase